MRRFIFVGDRGLFSKKNLETLRGGTRSGAFIVGMKLGVFKRRHTEFYDISRYRWIDDDLAVYETTHEGDRCSITWSRARAERDFAVIALKEPRKLLGIDQDRLLPTTTTA